MRGNEISLCTSSSNLIPFGHSMSFGLIINVVFPFLPCLCVVCPWPQRWAPLFFHPRSFLPSQRVRPTPFRWWPLHSGIFSPAMRRARWRREKAAGAVVHADCDWRLRGGGKRRKKRVVKEKDRKEKKTRAETLNALQQTKITLFPRNNHGQCQCQYRWAGLWQSHFLHSHQFCYTKEGRCPDTQL